MLDFSNVQPHEIGNYLENIADEISDDNVFYRPISEEERQGLLTTFANQSAEILAKEDAKKAQMAELTAKITALKAEATSLLHTIQTGKERKTGRLYIVRDEAAMTITAYDNTGAVIEQRPMRQTERQRIINFAKYAQND